MTYETTWSVEVEPEVERLRTELADLRRLQRASDALAAATRLDELLPRVLAEALRLTGSPGGAVALVGTGGRYLKELVEDGLEPPLAARLTDHLGALEAFCGTLPSALAELAPGEGRDTLVAAPVTDPASGARGYLLLAGLPDGLGPADRRVLYAFTHAAAAVLGHAIRASDAERRLQWLRAAGETGRLLLSGDVPELTVFQTITDTMRPLLDARAVMLILRRTEEGDDSEFEFVAVSGHEERGLVGHRYRHPYSLVLQAIKERTPVSVDYASLELKAPYPSATEFGPMIIVPLCTASGPRGAVVAARAAGDLPFSSFDEEASDAFGASAAIALEFVDARRQAGTIAVLAEQERIARALQDDVIQHLFATGLGLQATVRNVDGELRERLTATATGIDEAIAQVRQAIRTLQPPAAEVSLQTALLTTVRRLGAEHGLEPRVVFAGGDDGSEPGLVLPDVEAVLREALATAARHASAGVEVEVRTDEDGLSTAITDPGAGLADLGGWAQSLPDLRERAARLGGHLVLSPVEPRGLRLTWRIARR